MHVMQTARGASLSDADESSPRRRLWVLLGVAAVVIVIDQVTKHLAAASLADGHQVRLLDGLLTLRLVRNAGAAFGLASGATIIFSLVAVGVVVVVLRISRKLASLPWAISLGLLLGGAVGNLIDRLFRAPRPLEGHVVDFLELPHWPVFNVADSCLVLASVTMVLYTMLGMGYEGSSHRG